MKSLILLAAFCLAISGKVQSQTAKSFYFNGKNYQNAGAYVEPHPTETTYFTAALKKPGGVMSGEVSTVVSKIDAQGNTIWHTAIVHPGVSSSIGGVGDIQVNATHIFVSTLLDPATSTPIVKVYKLDFNGAVLDSVEIDETAGLHASKSEMDFDADGNLCLLTHDLSDNIHFCRIEPVMMNLVTNLVIGITSYTNPNATRNLFLQFDGTNTVAAFPFASNTGFVKLTGATVVYDFIVNTPDGDMTDFDFYNGEYYLLINKEFISSTASANPLRVMKVTFAGSPVSNDAFTVQNPVIFEGIRVDSDGNIFVVSGNQDATKKGGALYKISGGGIVYEHHLMHTSLHETELEGSFVFSSGVQHDGVIDCSVEANGTTFIRMKRTEVPNFAVVAPQMTLEVNSIDALISYNSSNFRDVENNYLPSEFVVDGAGRTIYGSSLLIAGEDINGQLKSSCGHIGNVFAAGPFTNFSDYTELERDKWERVWIITRDQVDAHIQAYLTGDVTYVMPEVIRHWPGNGDPSKGQSQQLARFQDLNGNTIYEPMLGEYPIIKGDFCALSVYNDINAGFWEICISPADRTGIQIFEYAYGFDCAQDSAMQNTLFISYEIISVVPQTLYNAHVGQNIDMDINFSTDDYISSDPLRGIFYGRDASAAGPEQAYMILGSTQDMDGMDNAAGIGTNESPNGLGYGNGTTDDERMGMTHFLYYNNSGGANGTPSAQTDFYKYMQGIWQNSAPLLYGGNGYDIGTTTTQCSFMFPDSSDQLWYSTSGINPGTYWSEEEAGNAPGDRRGLASSGPFMYFPYDTLFFDIAYVTGMQNTMAGYTSHEAMLAHVDSARNYFEANATACGQSFDFYAPFNGIYPYLETEEIEIPAPVLFPNPTAGNITIQGLTDDSIIRVFNLTGELISATSTGKSVIAFDYSDLPDGIYFVQIQNEDYSGTIRFVKQ